MNDYLEFLPGQQGVVSLTILGSHTDSLCSGAIRYELKTRRRNMDVAINGF